MRFFKYRTYEDNLSIVLNTTHSVVGIFVHTSTSTQATKRYNATQQYTEVRTRSLVVACVQVCLFLAWRHTASVHLASIRGGSWSLPKSICQWPRWTVPTEADCGGFTDVTPFAARTRRSRDSYRLVFLVLFAIRIFYHFHMKILSVLVNN